MKTFYEEDKVIINAKKAYQFLINRYKTPLDIPKNAWMQGKDMEVGKWYLWTDGGSEEKGPTHLQYIIMIPELFNNKVQTVNNFDALWYLTSPVSTFKLISIALNCLSSKEYSNEFASSVENLTSFKVDILPFLSKLT